MANIKVAVRVRPLSNRDSKNSESSVIVYAEQNRISLTNLKVPINKAGDSRERIRKYGFDYCFDSSDPRSANYAGQEKIYEILGKSFLNYLFTGYNSCLLAYGQSASGKTYTMMGTGEEPGLTPRLCQGIFARMDEEKYKENIFHVSVSYLEIYNERVRDLLEPSSNNHCGLKVREHPRLGPYVQGLTRRVASTLERLMLYIEGGNRARKTGSTSQNANSSRSHTLLTLFLTPETTKTATKPITAELLLEGNKTNRRYNDVASSGRLSKRNFEVTPPHYGSKLHLVDLAGSETARNCDGVHRLKEGANINKSLVALGNVISALAGKASTSKALNRKYIPYRDSSLTWLLKDALGGNATTIMLATISAARRNYNETAHTLRFAQRAHCVVNKPMVNEDPMARTIRELRAEIARLKSLLLEKNIEPDVKSLRYHVESESTNYDSSNSNTGALRKPLENERTSTMSTLIRRVNSSENLTTRDSDLIHPTMRKSGSYECLATVHTGYSYKRAKISELEDEEKELVGEINEAVFVDIPTLVAVLIKPDNSLQENTSAQIEEICSEEIQEYPIEPDFVESGEGEDHREEDHVSINHRRRRRGKLANNEYEEDEENHCDTISRKEKGKFCKQDSVNVPTSSSVSTNLYALSRRFGSADILEKKRDRLGTLERSNTSLEKQETLPEEINERYKETSKNSSYGSRTNLQGTVGNESEKTPKEHSFSGTSKLRNHVARKPSLENLRRKTSKDSSSSSSKDEQILVSSLTNERITKRKDSLDHSPSTRTHTPVQRAKRAEIVAAVTERLYSSRKQVDETTTGVTGTTLASLGSSLLGATSGVRSPPEGTDVRPISTSTAITSHFTAKSKLQEISRKMLAKRRRVNVETQTEQMQTIRVKDSASSTDERKIVCQDIGILTDEHTNHETKIDGRLPVIRVKEMATLTDKLKRDVKEFKDVECLVNDLNFYEYGVDSFNESKGRCGQYMVNKMSGTDSLELCLPNGDKVHHFDKSTSTSFPAERDPIIQSQPQQPTVVEETSKYFGEGIKNFGSSFERPERNIVSVSLPDSISITIETTNLLESRVMLITDETVDETKPCLKESDVQASKNSESQTEKQDAEWKAKSSNRCMGALPAKSGINQVDNKCFRIENIFEDPRNVTRSCKEEVSKTPFDEKASKTSVIFTNSLGTCFVPETKECATGMDKDKGHVSSEESGDILGRSSSSRDKSRSTDVWKNWIISFPSASWQRSRNVLSSVNTLTPWNFSWNDSLTPLNDEYTSVVSNVESGLNSSIFLPNDVYDKNQVIDLKSPSLIAKINPRRMVEQDYNFSDDSLDYNEDNVLANNGSGGNNGIKGSEEKGEGVENICPPDVVAHTKKESSILLGNSVESSVSLLEDQTELLKKKSHESRTELLENHSDNDNSVEVRQDTCEKRVTFLANEMGLSNRSRNFPKTVVKRKTHEAGINHYEHNFEDREKVQKDISQKTSKEEDSDSYEDVDSDQNLNENCVSMKLKSKVLEEYLNEATAFMRNINTLNEYVCGKTQRGNHRRSCTPRNYKNLETSMGDLEVSDISDDNLMDESLKEKDLIAPTESFEKCLKGLARLENCIRKTNEHDRYLREKYGIVVESAAAKSGLASSSIDSNTNSKISNSFVKNLSTKSGNTSKSDPGDLERTNEYQLTSSPPSCHYCCTKDHVENSYWRRARYDTRKHFHDNDRNSVNQSDDSSESIQLLENTLIKPRHCHERIGDNASRRTMADAFMRCTQSEMSNFINSRSFNRLARNDSKSCSLKRWRYRSESPRAKFLELLRERRRIVENSRDVRS